MFELKKQTLSETFSIYIDKRMINLDLMAKASIGLTYMNVPKGFESRIVVLYI